MSSIINKKNLEHLIELAYLEIPEKDQEKLLKDFQNILNYFEELQGLDTSNVEPLTGGTDLKNIFREDEERTNTDQGAGRDSFPKSKEGFLEIPAIFKDKND